jgi:hypothetical protein
MTDISSFVADEETVGISHAPELLWPTISDGYSYWDILIDGEEPLGFSSNTSAGGTNKDNKKRRVGHCGLLQRDLLQCDIPCVFVPNHISSP